MPVAKDGTLPIVRYVIRHKGIVEIEQFSCATCNMRLMAKCPNCSKITV